MDLPPGKSGNSYSPSASVELTAILQTGAFLFLCSIHFCHCHPADTFRFPGSGGQWGLCCGPSGLHLFALFFFWPCLWHVVPRPGIKLHYSSDNDGLLTCWTIRILLYLLLWKLLPEGLVSNQPESRILPFLTLTGIGTPSTPGGN